MPVTALWTLIISLAMLAFAFALKIADLKRTLHAVKKDFDTTRTELETLKQQCNQNEDTYKKRIEYLTKKLSQVTPDLDENPFDEWNKK